MALQGWHERDPEHTARFLRMHAGEPETPGSPALEAIWIIGGIFAAIAKLALLIAAIRLFF